MEIRSAIVIGAGRAGLSIASMLADVGVSIVAVTARTEPKADQAAEFLGRGVGVALDVNESSGRDVARQLFAEAPREGLLVVIAVPDDLLQGAAQLVSESLVDDAHIAAIHLSGGHGLDVLAPLTERGATVATLHPCFPIKSALENFVEDAPRCFTFMGSEELAPLCREMTENWGASFVELPELDRKLYHAACVFCAGHLTAVLGGAEELLTAVGLNREDAWRVIRSVSTGALRNLESTDDSPDIAKALTGPFVRGDKELIASQREAISKHAPELLPVYDALGELTKGLLPR